MSKYETIKYKKGLSKNQYKEMLDDICSEYCPSGKHCILKLYLLSSHPNPRLLIQLKCIEKYKYELNKNKKEEITWEDAWMSWSENGYAKKFAEVYTEEMTYNKIYKLIMN